MLVFCVLFGILSIFLPALRLALKVIFMVIGKGISAVFKVLWLIISAPFRGIAALVKRGRERRERKRSEREKQEQATNAKSPRNKRRKGKKNKASRSKK